MIQHHFTYQKLLLFILVLTSNLLSQAIQVTETRTSSFRGRPCDDTEWRDSNGSPAWKNYGGWLSECDSLEKTYHDSIFAEFAKEKAAKKAIQDSIEAAEIAAIDWDKELDMDAMWENTVWVEIQEIEDSEVYETEQITAVAGVRGAEAEDEALHHLYYRRSMKTLQKIDVQRAYGKLKNRRDEMFKSNPNNPKLRKLDLYLLQLQKRL